MIYALSIIFILYFTPGIAMCVRLYEYGSVSYILNFIFELPYYGYYVSFRVLIRLLEDLAKEKIIKNKSLIKNYYIAYIVWKAYVPVMFAKVGLIIIENSNEIKNKYKRASNNYQSSVMSDLKNVYA